MKTCILLLVFVLTNHVALFAQGVRGSDLSRTNRVPGTWLFPIFAPSGTAASDTQTINDTNLYNTVVESGVATRWLTNYTSPAAREVMYVGPNGNNNNVGSAAAPLATIYEALKRLGWRGTVNLLDGIYSQSTSLELATNDITIQAVGVVGVTNDFSTTYSSFTTIGGGVFRFTASSDWTFVSSAETPFIFEWRTPEGFIPLADRDFQFRHNYRLPDFYRITNISSIGTLTAGSFAISNSVDVYFMFSDGGAVNGRVVKVPSKWETNCFVFGGASAGRLKIVGINSMFGYSGFDLTQVKGGAELINCRGAGNYNEGFLAFPTGPLRFVRCRADGNYNDGFGYTTTAFDGGTNVSSIVEEECYAVYNGDEGTSGHAGIFWTIKDGIYECNRAGGITPALGAAVKIQNCYIRGNGIGISFASEPYAVSPTWTNFTTYALVDGCTITNNQYGVFLEDFSTNQVCDVRNSYLNNYGFSSLGNFVHYRQQPPQYIRSQNNIFGGDPINPFHASGSFKAPLVVGPNWLVGNSNNITLLNSNLTLVGSLILGTTKISAGTGNPNGSLSGNVGDMFLRTDGVLGNNSHYFNTNGGTGWQEQ